MDSPDITRRLDAALRPFAALRTDLSPERLDTTRVSLNRRRREMAQALDHGDVAVIDTEAHTVGVRIYRPSDGPVPAVVYCHAGAFVLGNLETDELQCVELARRAQCTVISVDYRLAPEHPYPAALDDVRTVLTWAVSGAADLGIDPHRIALAGSSAGAALAARMAQLSAAGLVPPVAFTLLHQPVLDDRLTPSKQEFTSTPGFDGPAAEQMWRYYLGGQRSCAGAVPAAAGELRGLAPTLITCSELDPLRDEALDYALRLMWAGVATELHVFPGTCHGFDSLVPQCETSQSLFELQGAALRRALHPAR